MKIKLFGTIRLYAIEIILLLWAVAMGVILLLPNSFIQTFEHSWHSYDVAIGVSFVVSSAVGFTGVFWQGKNIDTEWLLIRVGLVAQVFFWLAFGIATRFEGVLISAICLILFIRLVIRERAVRVKSGTE